MLNIYQIKKKITKQKVNFYFDGEKNTKRVENLNVEKFQSLPIIQQVVSGSKLRYKKQIIIVELLLRIYLGGKFDYSCYSNPYIVKEK